MGRGSVCEGDCAAGRAIGGTCGGGIAGLYFVSNFLTFLFFNFPFFYVPIFLFAFRFPPRFPTGGNSTPIAPSVRGIFPVSSPLKGMSPPSCGGAAQKPCVNPHSKQPPFINDFWRFFARHPMISNPVYKQPLDRGKQNDKSTAPRRRRKKGKYLVNKIHCDQFCAGKLSQTIAFFGVKISRGRTVDGKKMYPYIINIIRLAPPHPREGVAVHDSGEKNPISCRIEVAGFEN